MAAGAAAVAVIGTGCASGSRTEGRKPGPSYTPTGTMLLEVGRFSYDLVSYELPSGPGRKFPTTYYGGFAEGSFLLPDGSAMAMLPVFGSGSAAGQSRLFRFPLRGEARPIGRWLPGTQRIDLRRDRAISWGCFRRLRSIYTLSVSGHGDWRRAASGCSAALSPDGKEMAFVDRQTLFRQTLPDGRPEEILSLGSIPGLEESGITRIVDDLTSIAWGPAGIAVVLGNQGGWGIVVLRPGRDPLLTPLGSAVPQDIQWEPGGRLLAFGDYVEGNQMAELRVLDPDTGIISQVAATPTYGQFQWAPDGKVLVVVRTESVLSFVDTQGRTLNTLSIRGIPDAWGP